MTQPDEANRQNRRRELGEFVRSLREKLSPGAVGLPAGVRRRTPGLRREEIAQMSGLSPTWYTWLEQGREISLSPTALDRLAKALRLGRAERAYLFELAGKHDPHAADISAPAPPAALACVHAIDAPAYILDRSWTALSWNAPAEALFTGWLDAMGAATGRNLLRFVFTQTSARYLINDYEPRAQRVVAEFRADLGTHANDAAVRALIEELRGASADFARLWDEHAVLGREGGVRTFNHPSQGFRRFEQVSFALAHQPDLKLTILMKA